MFSGRTPLAQRGGRGGAAEKIGQQRGGFLHLFRIVGGVGHSVCGGHVNGNFAGELDAGFQFGVVDSHDM